MLAVRLTMFWPLLRAEGRTEEQIAREAFDLSPIIMPLEIRTPIKSGSTISVKLKQLAPAPAQPSSECRSTCGELVLYPALELGASCGLSLLGGCKVCTHCAFKPNASGEQGLYPERDVLSCLCFVLNSRLRLA